MLRLFKPRHYDQKIRNMKKSINKNLSKMKKSLKISLKIKHLRLQRIKKLLTLLKGFLSLKWKAIRARTKNINAKSNA